MIKCKIEEKLLNKDKLTEKDIETINEIVKRQIKFMIKYGILMVPKNYSILFSIFCNVVENNRPVTDIDILNMFKADLDQQELLEIESRVFEVQTRKDLANKLEIVANDIEEKLSLALENVYLHKENIEKHERLLKAERDAKFEMILTELLTLKMQNEKLIKKLEEYYQEIARLNTKLKIFKEDANIDFLTGISNRRSFERAINKLLKQFYEKKIATFSFILLDLDDFKKINDTYGHQAGDLVLKEISLILKSYLRTNTLVGRLGGEEFGIILPNVPLEDAIKVAERIRSIIENREIKYEDKVIRITASFGGTEVKEGDTFYTLYKRADEALYKAKNNNKNSVRWF